MTRPDRPDAPAVPAAVVFDLGGVLIDWDPRYLFRKLLPDEAAVTWFLKTICTPAWNSAQDAVTGRWRAGWLMTQGCGALARGS